MLHNTSKTNKTTIEKMICLLLALIAVAKTWMLFIYEDIFNNLAILNNLNNFKIAKDAGNVFSTSGDKVKKIGMIDKTSIIPINEKIYLIFA